MDILLLAGVDYEDQINTPIVFSAGSSIGESVCASIDIEDDDCVEEDESFTFTLSSDDPVDLVGRNGEIFIINDDSKCQVESK